MTAAPARARNVSAVTAGREGEGESQNCWLRVMSEMILPGWSKSLSLCNDVDSAAWMLVIVTQCSQLLLHVWGSAERDQRRQT